VLSRYATLDQFLAVNSQKVVEHADRVRRRRGTIYTVAVIGLSSAILDLTYHGVAVTPGRNRERTK
jgi:hypothetical protein